MPSLKSSKNPVRREVINGSVVYTKHYETDNWETSPEVRTNRLKLEVQVLDHVARQSDWPRRLGRMVVEEVDFERGIISTREVSGKPLDDWICSFRSRDPIGVHLRQLYLAGYWLRQFQGLDLNANELPPLSNKSPTDLCEYLGFRISAIKKTGYAGISDGQWDQAIAKTKQYQKQMSAHDRQIVICHNDYCPVNIICTTQKLTPIDFEMTGPGSRLQDVAYFLHRLEMMSIFRPWLVRPWQLLRRSFLAGYGRKDADQSPLYRALVIRLYALRLLTYAKVSPRNRKQAIHNQWVMALVRKRLIRELGR